MTQFDRAQSFLQNFNEFETFQQHSHFLIQELTNYDGNSYNEQIELGLTSLLDAAQHMSRQEHIGQELITQFNEASTCLLPFKDEHYRSKFAHALVIELLQLIGKRQHEIGQIKQYVDFDAITLVLDSSLFSITFYEERESSFRRERVYNIFCLDPENYPKLKPGQSVFIQNTLDDIQERKASNTHIILESMNKIKVPMPIFEEDGTMNEAFVDLDIADNSSFQPLSIIDPDYPGQFYFTFRNNSDDEGHLKSLVVRAIYIEKNNVPQDYSGHAYRIPVLKCTQCHFNDHSNSIVVNPNEKMIIEGFKLGTEKAAGLDMISEPFDIAPRGVAVKYISGLFQYRETECSPNQFVLRSRFSRNGLTLQVEPVGENDESVLKLTFQNFTNKWMQLPERVIQYLPSPTFAINETLFDCNSPLHNFFQHSNKQRQLKQ